MKKMMLFVLTLFLCFSVFGGSAFAKTAAAETATEMTAEELYQAGKSAKDAGDYEKALE